MEVERVFLLPFPDDQERLLLQLDFLSHNHCLQNSNKIMMFTFIIIMIVPSSTLESMISSIHFLFGFLSCLIVHLFFFLFVFNKSRTVITIQFWNIAIITKTSDSADFNYSCIFSIRRVGRDAGGEVLQNLLHQKKKLKGGYERYHLHPVKGNRYVFHA